MAPAVLLLGLPEGGIYNQKGHDLTAGSLMAARCAEAAMIISCNEQHLMCGVHCLASWLGKDC